MVKTKTGSKKILAITTAAFTMLTMTLAPCLAFADSGASVTKEETVYVITDGSGDTTDTIVSDRLKNNRELKTIEDSSNLTGIENVKGDEKFTQQGTNLTWKAMGKDIYYQGKTSEPVPVTMDISYRMNDKKLTGPEMQGKKGDFEISIEFGNNAISNGTTVPFIVMTGLLLHDDNYSNLEIDNGKIVDDGEKSIVVGLAIPGLTGSLSLDTSDITIGDTVTIKGKTDEFDVTDILTLATNSVFDDLDLDKFGDLNYDDQIDELDSGAKKLVDGSDTLYKGINQLNSKAPVLKDSVEQLHQGAENLTGSVDSTFTKMESGTIKLIDAQTKVAAGLKKIQAGIGNEEQTGEPTTIYGALGQIRDGIGGSSSSVAKAIGKTSDPVSDKTSEGFLGAADKAIDSAKASLDAADIPTGTNLSDAVSDLKSIVAALKAAGDNDNAVAVKDVIDSIKASDAYGDKGTTAKGKVSEALTSVAAAKEYVGDSVTVQNGIKDGMSGSSSSAVEAMNKVMEKTAHLYDQFEFKDMEHPGVNTSMELIIYNTQTLLDGIQAANSKMGTSIYTGAAALANYLGQLDTSTDQLIDGTKKLNDGSKQLSDGMEKLYKEGIKKIVDLYNNDLKGVVDDLDSIVSAGSNYRTFTKLPDSMDGSVKFIYRTSVDK